MRMIARLAAIATTTAAAGFLAVPANAADITYPALTGCSFTPLYTTNDNGRLSDIQYYYPRDTRVTVTGGDNRAWLVVVDRNGQRGWMGGECVLFLA